MNYKLNEYNPIEMIRIAENISQQEFGTKLGYPNKAKYIYNMREFTSDIIEKVKKTYDRDITKDIINHLKCESRKLKKQMKLRKKNVDKPLLNSLDKDQSISSIMDKV